MWACIITWQESAGKECFHDALKNVWYMHSVDDVDVFLGVLMEIWVNILMELMLFMEDIVKVIGV